ncbi:MAG TPA: FmdB family zinc ribbon protein [Anaeromyxobacteraceae bacterium]|nr:FmdB family zinc ribbon protein [Anaeromyxobacteraceae bacterium]
MPEYAFYCRPCKKQFTAVMTIAAHDKGVAPCPKCGKKRDVEKRIAVAYVVTSKKS